MEWNKVEKKENGVVIPSSWIYIHYYEALNALFRIENALRVFVYIVLKNELLDKWSDISITSDDSDKGTIASIGKKRVQQAQSFGYLGYPYESPMMYLTSGELIKIITEDSYWQYFKEYFPAAKNVVKQKLNEISVIRNSLAHFRPIKPEDVELIKINANHVLSEVGHCLDQISMPYKIVPTNTDEEWYKSLVKINSDLCNINIVQSEDEKWIRLSVNYLSKILDTRFWSENWRAYTILNIISPSILTYQNITKYITYLNETKVLSPIYKPESPSFNKEIGLVFSRKVIKDNYQNIIQDLDLIFKNIKEETELLIRDNLARGKLISIAYVSANMVGEEKKRWKVSTESTLCPISKNDKIEYWGDYSQFDNVITESSEYPWMNVKISET